MKDKIISFMYRGKKHRIRAEVCRDTWKKALGKMFSFSKKPLLFVFPREQKVSIHMLHVFMPLLVVWLDKNMKVVKIKKMRPYVSFESATAKYVLEIPLKKRLDL